MSHDHTCDGPVATNCGIVRAGWVACRRRSRPAPASRRIRYIVDCEHQ